MTQAKQMALCGILAALALVILCLGGLIPLSTYVCPVLCCMICQTVLSLCGRRMALTWYGAVAILGVLMGPDKEAALVYVLLGYYPVVKPMLEKSRLSFLWKALLFNGMIALLYGVLLKLLGLDAVMEETEDLGKLGLVILLILGNVVFFVLDRLLTTMSRKRRIK